MNDFKQVLDAEQVDRLVDGELLPEERKQILLEAETSFLEKAPAAWRQIALAYAESQQLEIELNHLSGLLSEQGGLEIQDEFEEQSLPSSTAVLEKPSRQSSFQFFSKASLAWVVASLLLAVSVGYWLGDIGASSRFNLATDTPDKNASDVVPINNTIGEQSKIDGNKLDTIVVLIPDPQTGRAITMTVPVLDAADVTEDLFAKLDVLGKSGSEGIEGFLTDSAREELIYSGYSIHEQQHLYPIKMDDGRVAIVPVRNVEVVANSYNEQFMQ